MLLTRESLLKVLSAERLNMWLFFVEISFAACWYRSPSHVLHASIAPCHLKHKSSHPQDEQGLGAEKCYVWKGLSAGLQ